MGPILSSFLFADLVVALWLFFLAFFTRICALLCVPVFFFKGCCHGDNTFPLFRAAFICFPDRICLTIYWSHPLRAILWPVLYFLVMDGVMGCTRRPCEITHLCEYSPPAPTPQGRITCSKHHFHHPLWDAAVMNHCLPHPRHHSPLAASTPHPSKNSLRALVKTVAPPPLNTYHKHDVTPTLQEQIEHGWKQQLVVLKSV